MSKTLELFESIQNNLKESEEDFGRYETYLIFEPVKNYDEVITKVIYTIQDIVGPVRVQFDGKQALASKKNGFDEGFIVSIKYDTDTNTIKDKISNILENPENHIISNNTVCVMTESEEVKQGSLVKTFNYTNYGYSNNETTFYGELNDGNWYWWSTGGGDVEIFNAPITQKFIDCIYNYNYEEAEEGLRDDEWLDNFIDEYEITKDYKSEDLSKIEKEIDKLYHGENYEEED